MKRRTFVQVGAAAIGSPAVSIANAQPVAVDTKKWLRKDVSSLAPNAKDLVLYSQAVQAMKELSSKKPEDPRGWRRQAQIHEAHCPHQNWWFLPWHRAYLWYFEQCCRDLVGDDFSLPYWDWTQNPTIPAPFWKGTLAHRRAVTPNDAMPNETVGRQSITNLMEGMTLSSIYSDATLTDDQREAPAAGDLESQPHNSVHRRVGTDGANTFDMVTLLSPLDPIFWLHHANVDRLWASWFKGRGNGRAPTSALWREHQLTRFFDPMSKSFVAPKTEDTKDAEKWAAIYDRYEPSPPLPSANKPSVEFLGRVDALNVRTLASGVLFPSSGVRIGRAMTATISTSADLAKILARVPAAAAHTDAPRTQTVLRVEGVEPPKQGAVALRVFLNCKDPTVNTPVDDPAYVATVSFFGGNHGEHQHPYNFALNAEKTIQRLTAAGQYVPGSSNVDVTLIPVNLTDPSKPSELGLVKAARALLVGAE